MTLLQSVFLPLALLASFAAGGGFLGVFLKDSDGATITQVLPDTAAAKAGLKVGDKFRRVNGKKTPDLESFLAAMGRFDAGDEVKLVIQRGKGDPIVMDVVLGKRPDQIPELGDLFEAIEEVPAPAASRPARTKPAERPTRLRPTRRAAESAPSRGRPFVGVQVEQQDEGGLVVTEVVDHGPAAAAGIKAGDRLIGLGRADKIRSLSDLTDVLGKLHAGQTVRAVVRRGDDTETLSVKLGTRPSEQGGDRAVAMEGVRADEAAERTAMEQAKAAERQAMEKARGAERKAKERAKAAERKARDNQKKARDTGKRAATDSARSRRMATRLDRPARGSDGEERELRQLRDELRSMRKEIRELKELVRSMNKKKK